MNLHNGMLFTSSYETSSADFDYEYQINTVKIPDLFNSSPDVEPSLVYSYTRTPSSPSTSNPSPSFNFGDQLLAYSDGRDLHVRTYDGSVDVLLESGVPFIGDIRGPYWNIVVLR
jgi:hypothetical protein